MSLIYFDCFSGASGDMVLGALIDAGVPLDGVRDALGGLAIEPDTIWTEQVLRGGIRATKFCVRGEDDRALATVDPANRRHAPQHRHDGSSHTHEHPRADRPAAMSQGEHGHRTLQQIGHLIDSSGLSATARARAKELFARLGEAEAAIHGTSMEQVHLHEVGALDSIIDIVGAVYAMEHIGATRVVASPLNVGSGMITSAHGHYPVPAPATLRLLNGVPMYSGPQQQELVTPTGALLVTGYASEYGTIPPMRVEHVGYGAGARDFHQRPNVLRVLVGHEDVTTAAHGVVVIEAEIDDMNPQIFGVVMDALLADGALDVFYTPIQMKKNRPGTLLTAIARPTDRERLTARIFRETTTIGVRYREMARECLDRQTVRVDTPYGPISIKVARRGSQILNATAEFDECVRAAREFDRPVKDVQAAATKAFLDRPR